MDFGIKIAIDPGSAKPTVDGVTASFEKLETAGPKATTAVNAGLREFAAAAKAGAAAQSQLTEEERIANEMNLVGNAQRRLQNEILDQVVGTQQRYRAEVEALDGLYARGKLTLSEYNDQLERRNKALNAAQPSNDIALLQHGPAFSPGLAGAGPVGPGVTPTLAGAGPELLGEAAVAAAGVAAVATADHYIELANAAQRLVKPGEDVAGVLQQQLALSEELHGSMATTIGLTAQLAEATHDMNLGNHERITLEKTLAEQVQLSGKSLDDAASLFAKVGFAAEQGSFAPRELRAIFKEYPLILNQMEAALGKNEVQLMAMAKAGKFTADTFVQVELAQAGATDAKFANQIETAGQQWQHFKDGISLTVGKFVEGTGIFNTFGAALHAIAGIASGVVSALGAIDGALDKVSGGILKLNAGTVAGAAVAGPIGALVGTVGKNFLDATSIDKMNGYADVIAKIRKEEQDTQASTEKWSDVALKAGKSLELFGTAIQGTEKWLADLRKQLDSLHPSMTLHEFVDWATGTPGLMKKDAEDLKKAGEQYAQLWKHTYEEATGGAGKFNEQVGMLDKMLTAHLITVGQYRAEMDKLTATFAGGDIVKALGELRGTSLTSDAKYIEDLQKVNDLYARQKISLLELLGLYEKLDEQHDSSTIPRSVTGGSLAGGAAGGIDIGGGLDGQGAKQDAIAAHRVLEDALAGSRNATARYDEEVQKLNHSLMGLKPNADEYQKALAAIRDRYNDMRTPEEQFAKGVQDVDDKLAAHIYTLTEAERAMRKLREATGRGTFGDGFDSFVDSLKKQGEDSKTALDLMNAGFSSVNTGIMDLIESKGSLADWGASFLSTMAKVAEQALATKLMLSLIGLGGAPQSIETSLAGSIFGVPGHASGAYYPPGGSGGTDSQFVAFRKSPSEDVLVRTPEQQRAMAQGGGGSVTPVINIITGPRDRRDLQPPGPSRGEINVMIDQRIAASARRR